MQDSLWFSTRSALFTGGDAAWQEVARYGEPLRRLLARRYRWMPEADREDLVQDVLIEMKQKLAPGHDRSRGRFRALLQAVVKRRVVDRLRRARPEHLDHAAADALSAPAEEEVDALDLEGALLEAVAACRDRFTQGRHKDLAVVYALADRLVHGRTNAEIAARDGVSVDRVARLLRRGRDAVFAHLLGEELAVDEDDPALKEALEAFKGWLRTPRERVRHLERVRDPRRREQVDAFVERFSAALPAFRGDDSARGRELARGIELIFDGDDEVIR